MLNLPGYTDITFIHKVYGNLWCRSIRSHIIYENLEYPSQSIIYDYTKLAIIMSIVYCITAILTAQTMLLSIIE